MTRSEKINAIIDAARNNNLSDKIDDIDLLEYFHTEHGVAKVFEDRFDFIDVTTCPASIWFICGTGHDNINVPIAKLTDTSIDMIYNCINK